MAQVLKHAVARCSTQPVDFADSPFYSALQRSLNWVRFGSSTFDSPSLGHGRDRLTGTGCQRFGFIRCAAIISFSAWLSNGFVSVHDPSNWNAPIAAVRTEFTGHVRGAALPRIPDATSTLPHNGVILAISNW